MRLLIRRRESSNSGFYWIRLLAPEQEIPKLIIADGVAEDVLFARVARCAAGAQTFI
jgi:hypothetical protein